jgi:hypothetical protein
MRRRSDVQGSAHPVEFCRQFLSDGVRLVTT